MLSWLDLCSKQPLNTLQLKSTNRHKRTCATTHFVAKKQLLEVSFLPGAGGPELQARASEAQVTEPSMLSENGRVRAVHLLVVYSLCALRGRLQIVFFCRATFSLERWSRDALLGDTRTAPNLCALHASVRGMVKVFLGPQPLHKLLIGKPWTANSEQAVTRYLVGTGTGWNLS